MTFNDFTLLGGSIKSRRQHDTDQLAQPAILDCQTMLKQLRRGDLFVQHGISDLPRFGVSLGLPPELAQKMGRDRLEGNFFCVGETPDALFQMNLVLSKTDLEMEPVATMMGLSLVGGITKAGNPQEQMKTMQTLFNSAPCLITALMPVMVSIETVQVAADFATCFAAAMLLEEETDEQ